MVVKLKEGPGQQGDTSITGWPDLASEEATTTEAPPLAGTDLTTPSDDVEKDSSRTGWPDDAGDHYHS